MIEYDRAIDSHGLTLDFELRKHRDYQSAYHFLKRLLTTYGRPDCLVTDQYAGTLKAIKQVIKDGLLVKANHQCSKYRNNLIEQDHRLIKHVVVPPRSWSIFFKISPRVFCFQPFLTKNI